MVPHRTSILETRLYDARNYGRITPLEVDKEFKADSDGACSGDIGSLPKSPQQSPLLRPNGDGLPLGTQLPKLRDWVELALGRRLCVALVPYRELPLSLPTSDQLTRGDP